MIPIVWPPAIPDEIKDLTKEEQDDLFGLLDRQNQLNSPSVERERERRAIWRIRLGIAGMVKAYRYRRALIQGCPPIPPKTVQDAYEELVSVIRTKQPSPSLRRIVVNRAKRDLDEASMGKAGTNCSHAYAFMEASQ